MHRSPLCAGVAEPTFLELPFSCRASSRSCSSSLHFKNDFQRGHSFLTFFHLRYAHSILLRIDRADYPPPRTRFNCLRRDATCFGAAFSRTGHLLVCCCPAELSTPPQLLSFVSVIMSPQPLLHISRSQKLAHHPYHLSTAEMLTNSIQGNTLLDATT
jgi:hypothetical protein